ncbi:MAG TPA: hypothetical protein VES70_33600 [Pseudomonas sp.]|nr:hypothetical protein [Pseudomonas sp.]
MIDYYLRTSDPEAMYAALSSLGDEVTIDDIGVLYRVADDGETVEALPGYHANVRSPDPIEWPDTIENMNPETPWRVFA